MGKILVKVRNNRLEITHRLQNNESVNTRELDLISIGEIDRLLPVYLDGKRHPSLSCTLENPFSLKAFFLKPMDRKVFLGLVTQIMELVEACEERIMQVKNIDFDKDRIFIHPFNHQLQFVYWPVVNYEASVNLVTFLKTLPQEVTVNPTEDLEFIRQYQDYFEKPSPFSFNGFKRLIESMSQEGPQRVIQTFTSETDSHNLSKEPTKPDWAYRPDYGHEPPPSPSESLAPPPEAPPAQQAEDPTDQTVFLGLGTRDSMKPTLQRNRTGEKREIDKDRFRVGIQASAVDYWIADNHTISRHHVTFYREGNRFFIEDNDSTNGTWLDGVKLLPNHRTEVHHGSMVKISNELFTFVVE